MTMLDYEKATKILKEKEQLEEKLYRLRMSMDFNFNSKEYTEIINRLFVLGQEFASL